MKKRIVLLIVCILFILNLIVENVFSENWDKILPVPSQKVPIEDALFHPFFIKLKSGRLIETDLYELKFIGRFQNYVILSGRQCYECDAPFEVFIHPINVESIKIENSIRHDHPGIHHLEGDLIYKAKAFWGYCLSEKEPEIIWFETHFDILNGNKQSKKVYSIKVDPKGNLTEKEYDTNMPDINMVLRNKANGICQEIKGLKYTSL